jgi:hypothetical protein
LNAINTELEKIGPDDSDLRAAFAEWLAREIEKLETDPERAAAKAERPRPPAPISKMRSDTFMVGIFFNAPKAVRPEQANVAAA